MRTPEIRPSAPRRPAHEAISAFRELEPSGAPISIRSNQARSSVVFCCTTSRSPRWNGADVRLLECGVRISVDLPAPLGPSRPYIPAGIASVTSFSACTSLE